MSGPVVLDRAKLALAFSEIEEVRRALPKAALNALAQEVVKQVAENLVVALPAENLPTSAEIDVLCDALLSQDDSAAIALIEQAQKHGTSYDVLCLFYLSEASRRLGSRWDDDKVSFYQVTTAAGRIYALLRILRLQQMVPLPNLRRSAVFVSVPGEQHTLGITIAADMARSHGWDIELLIGHTHDELVELLLHRDTGLIGLSASTKRALPDLIKLMVALRISNPRAKIVVCGPVAAGNNTLEGVIGADATALDFETALRVMERLVTLNSLSRIGTA